MKVSYAEHLGLRIHKDQCYRNHLVFADGTQMETLGQVYSQWTFASGKSIPITFEVIDACFADIVIGEEVLWGHKVFERYASSIVMAERGVERSGLAPFDFVRSWERRMKGIMHSVTRRQHRGDSDLRFQCSRSHRTDSARRAECPLTSRRGPTPRAIQLRNRFWIGHNTYRARARSPKTKRL